MTFAHTANDSIIDIKCFYLFIYCITFLVFVRFFFFWNTRQPSVKLSKFRNRLNVHYPNILLAGYFKDNSLMEWAFKKAITIQTYSSYDPIPVPLNLVSSFVMGVWWLWKKCRRSCKGHPDIQTATGHVSYLACLAILTCICYKLEWP